jgi:trehalose 6-phosphate synthase
MQRELAEEVGRINGKFGDVDWTPLRYLNKPMSPAALAGLYRMSRVGLVTPLRDGMNLVAKEYVAAQAPNNPGVLVLSQFAGAAQELKSALIVNPYDIDAMADALARAFAMPLEERKDRWHAMMAVLRANSVHDWASHFLAALATDVKGESSDSPVAESSFSNAVGVARPEHSTAARRTRSALPRASSQRRSTIGATQPLSKAPRRTPPLRPNGSAITFPAETLLNP